MAIREKLCPGGMRTDIVNGMVVVGDGKTVLDKTSIVTENGIIASVPRVRYVGYNVYAERVIDAEGGLILPGLCGYRGSWNNAGTHVP